MHGQSTAIKTWQGFESFYDLVETKYRALQALEVEEGVYSAIVVPMLLEKIRNTLRLTITRGQNYLDWALGDMLNALLIQVELREDQCLTQQAWDNRAQ